ncbi:MAG: hypothetical protein CM1200mP13_11990 [Candidatus Pelagibacterales bacterium]|nr:MAG: hypothetical protein CM1200mP13_11990 [Pelagibacterales bacterium]
MASDFGTSLDHEDDDPGTVWNKEARGKKIVIECPQDKLGERYKQVCLKML